MNTQSTQVTQNSQTEIPVSAIDSKALARLIEDTLHCNREKGSYDKMHNRHNR